MGENVNAFKALYVAFGGKLTDYYSDICNGAPVSQYSLTSDVVYALAKLAPGIAAKELPEVDAEYNGKVLKVIEGEWGVGTDLIEA